ncbi:hypothetical protein C1631_009590 [Chryseobacterium phosphatilyticum]|uniref:FAD-binding domain-containing protein n=1 Tax=Chryseobacterium phosphatilyticum TaxID=475075 RepID=A0A316XHE9_9FLAO|nr:FAD-dependent monooxygenase [Chryseobacterium phosphatilyticum]PWN70230.1 hypothetical protein C1631_009590 [Chryseobacterium phosphatilyticum]
MSQTTKSKEYDVCIVGAGIAGILLAWLLGSQNKKVLILEKNAEINMNGADILKPSGIDVLEKYGLFQELLKKDCRVRDKLKVFHNGNHVHQIDYALENERGYFMVCPYHILLETIYDKIQKISTIELRVSQTVSKINETDKGVDVTLNSGEDIFCEVLIGADGIHSIVRNHTDIKAHFTYYDQVMYFKKYPITSSIEEINRLYVDEKGGLAYFYPINKTEARCILGFKKDEGQKLMEGGDLKIVIPRLKQFITESDDILGQIKNLEDFCTFPLCRMHTEQYYKGRILLLGNAAHSIHPITGQGMNLAIEDTGELFIWLSAYFDRTLTLDEAFSGYQEKRFDINHKVIEYGHQLANSFETSDLFINSLNPKVQTSSRKLSVLNNI